MRIAARYNVGMNIHQVSCREGKGLDLRQAKAVLRHRPDVIIFEAPPTGKTADLVYNKYPPSRKPLKALGKYKKMLKDVSRKAPWVLSDVHTFNNIEKLWAEGHDVKLYNVDGPHGLLNIKVKYFQKGLPKAQRRGTHFDWWVRIYLRETIMVRHVRKILEKARKDGTTVLVFLQSFHWRNVQFLLKNPTKAQIYKYYFGAFKGMNLKTIDERVSKSNPPLYRYWKKISIF